jgi:serine O-acetyltransferase
MRLEISIATLQALVARQLKSLFCLDRKSEYGLIVSAVPVALDRCEYCFASNRNKYYSRAGEVYFNPFHSGQYAIFLYFLAEALAEVSGVPPTLCDRVYYLNKCLNGLDLFHEVKMPRIFFLDHPVGSVLGRAKYGEYFSFSQNCTVGNNHGHYPVFGENVALKSGAKVVGRSQIGSDVIIAANAYVKDFDVPDGSIVFGMHPNLVIKSMPRDYFRQHLA